MLLAGMDSSHRACAAIARPAISTARMVPIGPWTISINTLNDCELRTCVSPAIASPRRCRGSGRGEVGERRDAEAFGQDLDSVFLANDQEMPVPAVGPPVRAGKCQSVVGPQPVEPRRVDHLVEPICPKVYPAIAPGCLVIGVPKHGLKGVFEARDGGRRGAAVTVVREESHV